MMVGGSGYGVVMPGAWVTILDAPRGGFLYWSMSWIRQAPLSLLVSAGLFLLVAGCSSKGPIYPEDHARFTRIDEAVETLRRAYVKKEFSTIKALMLPLESLEAVAKGIQEDFDRFEDISLDLSIERIVIDQDAIDVFIHWQGQWRQTVGDTGLREHGQGVLRWVGVQSILLRGLDGDHPFGMTARMASVESVKPAAPDKEKGRP